MSAGIASAMAAAAGAGDGGVVGVYEKSGAEGVAGGGIAAAEGGEGTGERGGGVWTGEVGEAVGCLLVVDAVLLEVLPSVLCTVQLRSPPDEQRNSNSVAGGCLS